MKHPPAIPLFFWGGRASQIDNETPPFYLMRMTHFGNQIVPAEFPELKMLAWSRNPARPIAADEAFALYERNWRFVDRENLTPHEKLLIKELTEEYGHGLMLV